MLETKNKEKFFIYALPFAVMVVVQFLMGLANLYLSWSWALYISQIILVATVVTICHALIIQKFMKEAEGLIESHKVLEMEEREKRIKAENDYIVKMKQVELEEAQKRQEELTKRERNAVTWNAHLANVISGINHEISPWIGGVKNILARLQVNYKKYLSGEKMHKSGEFLVSSLSKDLVESGRIVDKFDQMSNALDCVSNILQTLSCDVKKLQQYSSSRSSIKDTISSWVSLTLMDRFIKEMLTEKNIRVDSTSLAFVAVHSPLHLSQIILNLAKNSFEHNMDMLDDLYIDIYGIPTEKKLILEDNGKGILEAHLQDIFSPGYTSKKDEKGQHGLGLHLCRDYCALMGAKIEAVKKDGKGVKFVITFEVTTAEIPVAHKIITKQKAKAFRRRRVVL